jgi:hypothetical protein
MAVLTLKVLASVLQLHGPGATVESDHQGIDALLGDVRGRINQEDVAGDDSGVTKAAFGRAFAKAPVGGAFRRGMFRRY